MSNSGCLFDFEKLNDVSKNVISKWSAERVYDELCEWAKEYDPEFGREVELLLLVAVEQSDGETLEREAVDDI